MKSIEEQTREAAENHCDRFDDLSQEERKSCIGDFISGANWERSRDKWISVNDDIPKFNKNVNALTSRNRAVLSFIDGSGNFDLHECDQFEDEKEEYEHIVAWQYVPEPPKQKS